MNGSIGFGACCTLYRFVGWNCANANGKNKHLGIECTLQFNRMKTKTWLINFRMHSKRAQKIHSSLSTGYMQCFRRREKRKRGNTVVAMAQFSVRCTKVELQCETDFITAIRLNECVCVLHQNAPFQQTHSICSRPHFEKEQQQTRTVHLIEKQCGKTVVAQSARKWHYF